MDTMACEPKTKLSAAKSVGFRAGPQLRGDLECLVAELSRPGAELTISDILRDGVTAYWPQIRAWHQSRQSAGNLTPEEITRFVAALTKAHQFGLEVAEIEHAISNAISEKAGGVMPA